MFHHIITNAVAKLKDIGEFISNAFGGTKEADGFLQGDNNLVALANHNWGILHINYNDAVQQALVDINRQGGGNDAVKKLTGDLGSALNSGAVVLSKRAPSMANAIATAGKMNAEATALNKLIYYDITVTVHSSPLTQEQWRDDNNCTVTVTPTVTPAYPSCPGFAPGIHAGRENLRFRNRIRRFCTSLPTFAR